jgi:hypothetical protein
VAGDVKASVHFTRISTSLFLSCIGEVVKASPFTKRVILTSYRGVTMNQLGNSQKPVTGAPAAGNQRSGSNAATYVGEDVWDEERLEKAMAQLKEMHIQVGIGSSRHYLAAHP